MPRGHVTYGQTRSASGFGGDWTYRRDAERCKRTQNVAPKGFRALDQCANCIGAGEQEPVEGAQSAKGVVQGGKVIRRVESNHRIEHGSRAASLEFANQQLTLV
jgi:hypothetical protein